MSETLQLAQQLIALPSVTPADAGCLALASNYLTPLGFNCERIDSGPDDFRVSNLWALRQGTKKEQGKTLVFAGHVDVVPTGPLEQWDSPPFSPAIRAEKLYGRGASDMKTPLAAMLVAVRQYLSEHPDTALNIGWILTSDEEGPALDGTVVVCRTLQQRGQQLDYCIVGEPTSAQQVGDTVKNGRRGSLSGKLTVKGVQGHIAYPHLAKNPIHLLAPALAELTGINWDEGNAFFPPTSWQVSNIHAGTGAGNVIPGSVVVDFNFRFSTASTPNDLQQRFENILQSHGLDFELQWTLGGLPFLTPPGTLVDAVRAAIADVTGLQTELSTSGGTSDGRFIAQICPQVVEVGPTNATIHQINECIALAEIEPLTAIYRRVLDSLGSGV